MGYGQKGFDLTIHSHEEEKGIKVSLVFCHIHPSFHPSPDSPESMKTLEVNIATIKLESDSKFLDLRNVVHEIRDDSDTKISNLQDLVQDFTANIQSEVEAQSQNIQQITASVDKLVAQCNAIQSCQPSPDPKSNVLKGRLRHVTRRAGGPSPSCSFKKIEF